MTLVELFTTINNRGLRLAFRDGKPTLEPSDRVDDALRKALEENAANLTPLADPGDEQEMIFGPEDDAIATPPSALETAKQILATPSPSTCWYVGYAIATCRLWHLIRVCAHDETRLRLVQVADFVPSSEQEWIEHRQRIRDLEDDIMTHGRWPGLPYQIVRMFG